MRREGIKMSEVIEIIAAGIAGIAIGLTFGYIAGYHRGYDQGYGQAKRDDVISHRYEFGGL